MEKYRLSETEHQVLSLICLGNTREQTARKTGLSPSGVARTIRDVQNRLSADNTVQLVAELIFRSWWNPYAPYSTQVWSDKNGNEDR